MTANPAARLTRIIRHLSQQGASEATIIADLLDSLIASDDSEMMDPTFVSTVLDEVIGWAQQAKALNEGTIPWPATT
jgi:hypothetical protein